MPPEPWCEARTRGTRALVLRPESEAEIPRIASKLRTFRSHGHQTFVARLRRHGASMLDSARVEGDLEEAREGVLAFLASLPGVE